MKPRLLLLCLLLLLLNTVQAQLIQGTIKPGSTGTQVELWLKPDFTNSTQYLAQVGLPVAFSSSVSPVPTGLSVTLDPAFVSSFGSNYTVTVNPIANNTGNTEKYFNIVLVRTGPGASLPQSWTQGTEFKILTATFTYSGPVAEFQAKLADYQDGGSDGQSFFYTADGNGNYYFTPNSVNNFYASGSSVTGGDASAGYAQVSAVCTAPSTPAVTNITASGGDISWQTVNGAAGYEYAINTNSTAPASGTAITGTSFPASGLNSCTQYYVHVRTSCGADNFSSWTTTSFTTLSVPPSVSAITGTTSVCVTSATQLNNATAAGTWSSNNTGVATVDANGLVTAVSQGTATISYAVTNTCGLTTTVTAPITVNNVPVVAAITGITTISIGNTSQFNNTTSGGVWSSNNTGVATVDANGLVMAVSQGTATISYTVTNSCGTTAVTALVTVGSAAAQLMQGTIKKGTATGLVEIWLKPNFSNTTQYLFQLGMPVAFPAGASPQPSGLPTVTLDPSFTSIFGNNYTVVVNPVANNSANTEKYFNIILTRNGPGGSVPQSWTAGTEYKLLSVAFAPSNAIGAPVKLADYQDGGSDGQGYFYSADGNGNYYMTTNSVDNFYSSPGNSATGGDGSAGYAVTLSSLGCDAPVVPAITGTTSVCANSVTQLANTTTGGVWFSNNTSIATVDVNGLVTGVGAGTVLIDYTVTNSCGSTTVSATITVNTLPAVAAITGNTSLTTGTTSQLSNTTAGGTWSSDNTGVATVDANGLVTALSSGSAVIMYSLTNSCGSGSASATVTVNGSITKLIQGTIKPGAAVNEVEIWIKPNFNNSTEYIAQLGLPVAVPVSASPQPTALSVSSGLDPAFTNAFGNNYTVVVNPVAANSTNTEKYFNIVLTRNGAGASLPQTWTAGTEYKVLTASFTPSASPNSTVKLADYQDGGSDGQGYFYSADGNANYYMTTNSVGNFYASPGNSITGGDAAAGYAQTIAIVPASCAAPSGLIANNVTSAGADISWNPVNGVVGYEYVYSTTNAAPVGTGTATSLPSTGTLSGLLPATTYYVFVRSNCGGSYSAWVSVSFTTTVISCTAPAGLVANNVTSTGATISWDPVTGTTGYQYIVTTTNATPVTAGTPVTGTTAPASALIPGTVYYAFVRSNCGSGFSSWTMISFTTLCPPPVNAIVSSLTPTGATISWIDIADVEGYQYILTTDPAIPVAPFTGAVSTLFPSFQTGVLIPGTTYYAYIRTNCGPGVYSEWAMVSFTTPYPPCTAPASITISNISNTADISWPVVNGAPGYEYAVTTSATAPSAGNPINTNAYQITGLNANTQYFVYVRTSCGSGQFSSWAVRSFVTSCFRPSPYIVGNDIITGTANLAWKKIPGALKYEYTILNNAAPPAGSQVFTIDTVLHVNNLLPGVKYYLHVRAFCGPTSLSEWSIIEFYTSGIVAYPNPTMDKITVSLYGDDKQNKELGLYDAGGKFLLRIRLTGNSVEIDMRRFAAGIYFIKYNGNKKYLTRILKW